MTDHDPLRDLWASDQEEKFTMSITDLSARSDRFQSRSKRRNLIEYLAAALVVGVFGWMAFIIPVLSIKIGAVMIMMAAIYISWQLNRVASLSAGDTAGDTLANIHRRELVRQRDALRSVWCWYLLPFVPESWSSRSERRWRPQPMCPSGPSLHPPPSVLALSLPYLSGSGQ